MKHTYFLLILFFCFGTKLNAQVPESYKLQFFKSWMKEPVKREVIASSWKEYFNRNVLLELGIDTTEETFPLYFDPYGLPLGDIRYYTSIPNKRYEGFSKGKNKIKRKHVYKRSLYTLFFLGKEAPETRELFLQDVKIMDLKKGTNRHDELKNLFDRYSSKLGAKNYTTKVDCALLSTFNQDWSKLVVQYVMLDLKQKLKAEGKTNLFLFIHGYNVPHSLAAIQFKTIRDSIHYLAEKCEENYLFVPVFWPSGDGKLLNLNSEKEFSTKSSISFLKSTSYHSKKQFQVYSNSTTYYVAHTLRLLIDKQKFESPSTKIFAHSLGCKVAMNFIFNNRTNFEQKDMVNKRGNVRNKFETCEWKYIREDMDSLFKQKEIYNLNKQFDVFLSAPAIPGKPIFFPLENRDYLRDTNYLGALKFYCTYNTMDPMLTKTMLPLLRNLGLTNAHRNGETTLGCNFNNEALDIKRFWRDSLYECGLFQLEKVVVPDHDVFIYLREYGYQKFLQEFSQGDERQDVLPSKQFKEGLVKLNLYYDYANIWDKTYETKARIRATWLNLTYNNVNLFAEPMRDALYKSMVDYGAYNELNKYVVFLLTSVDNPYNLYLLQRSIKNDKTIFYYKEDYSNECANLENPIQIDAMRKLLLDETDKMLSNWMLRTMPYYTYSSSSKKPIKFINIKTGNDLFTRQNYDRDYTGSVLLEFATDYLDFGRNRPVKTYQTFYGGFDVYTPSIRDSATFNTPSAVDSTDRPYACFQYIGYSRYGLSRYDRMRWNFNLKLGLIGGNLGEQFQSVLHRDISKSIRPYGWASQIGEGGMFAFSIEPKIELLWDLFRKRRNEINKNNLRVKVNEDGFFRFYGVYGGDLSLGSYKTFVRAKFGVRNKKFSQSNHHSITIINKQNAHDFWDHFFYEIAVYPQYMFHNTTLEGHGIFSLNEDLEEINKQLLSGASALSYSRYFLTKDQVQRWGMTGNVNLSYTFSNFTIIYNYYLISPETKLGQKEFTYGNNITDKFNIGKRWHRFAEIGLTFNLK